MNTCDDDSAELPHEPGKDPAWQESVFLHWFDPDAGIGGIHRIGHEPHEGDSGIAALWCGVFTEDGTRFCRRGTPPLRDEDRQPDGFGAGPGHRMWFDRRPRIHVDDAGCSLDLEVEDFYPRTDFFPAGATVSEEFAKHHFEASGRVRGTAVLDGRTYDVEGLCHRDHSWGPRRWDTLLTHRWVSGTFGPQLSFGSITWHGVDGSLLRAGYVVRDGQVIPATDVDVVVFMEADGMTHRGGEVTWSLPDGDQLQLSARLVDGVLNVHRGIACVDSLCRVEYQGRSGHCDFEISTNPRNGTGPVLSSLRAVATDGLSRR